MAWHEKASECFLVRIVCDFGKVVIDSRVGGREETAVLVKG